MSDAEMSDAEVSAAPVRPIFLPLCCGMQHHGAACPDGRVMCCLCFSRFTEDELHMTADGMREDVCQACAEAEEEAMKRRSNGKPGH